MIEDRKKIGQQGEELAKKYLIKKKYKIKHQNITFGHKEIDIVAQKGKYTVFVEVKTRTFSALGGADTALTSKQIKTLKKAINFYIHQYKINKDFIRLDLISIDVDRQTKEFTIQHFEDIF